MSMPSLPAQHGIALGPKPISHSTSHPSLCRVVDISVVVQGPEWGSMAKGSHLLRQVSQLHPQRRLPSFELEIELEQNSNSVTPISILLTPRSSPSLRISLNQAAASTTSALHSNRLLNHLIQPFPTSNFLAADMDEPLNESPLNTPDDSIPEPIDRSGAQSPFRPSFTVAELRQYLVLPAPATKGKDSH